jgi:hypothetical protein
MVAQLFNKHLSNGTVIYDQPEHPEMKMRCK